MNEEEGATNLDRKFMMSLAIDKVKKQQREPVLLCLSFTHDKVSGEVSMRREVRNCHKEYHFKESLAQLTIIWAAAQWHVSS